MKTPDIIMPRDRETVWDIVIRYWCDRAATENRHIMQRKIEVKKYTAI